MRIYIDEDLASGLLIRLLQKAGHDVEAPTGAGMLGRSDPVQFTFAIHENRVCLTANYDDYEELHWLVLEVHGSHTGILIVRQDNDPARDLTPKGIVAAIRKLEAAGVPIANELIILNHWR
jgi:predicted nuclease of predicted toxin-antitoxin system